MLVSMVGPMQDAKRGGYCVPALAAVNETMLRGCVEAAEEAKSPVIILVIHDMAYDLNEFGAIARDVAQRASVPVSVLLDHGATYEHCVEAIRAGFTDVMLDRSSEPFQKNVADVAEVVKMAHAVGVGVEAELGHVGQGEDYDDAANTVFTVPEEALRYLDESGCDTLAVSVGTSHGVYKGTPKINFELLAQLRDTLPVPLVIHGGSGTGEENLRRMCRSGANKLNIAHDLYDGAYNAITAADMTGNGSYQFFQVARAGIREAALHTIDICGSANKA